MNNKSEIQFGPFMWKILGKANGMYLLLSNYKYNHIVGESLKANRSIQFLNSGGYLRHIESEGFTKMEREYIALSNCEEYKDGSSLLFPLSKDEYEYLCFRETNISDSPFQLRGGETTKSRYKEEDDSHYDGHDSSWGGRTILTTNAWVVYPNGDIRYTQSNVHYRYACWIDPQKTGHTAEISIDFLKSGGFSKDITDEDLNTLRTLSREETRKDTDTSIAEGLFFSNYLISGTITDKKSGTVLKGGFFDENVFFGNRTRSDCVEDGYFEYKKDSGFELMSKRIDIQ